MTSLSARETVSARRFTDDSDDSDDSETPIEVNAGGASDGCGGARRAVGAAVGLLVLSSALAALWAARAPRAEGGGGRPSFLPRAAGGATLGRELIDAEAEALNSSSRSDGRGAQGDALRRPIANAPHENLHDGNVCDDDEELFGHLCYKKCSLLTNGQYPTRSSAWSCCTGGADSSSKCSLFKQKVRPWICGGFDVGGDRVGNGCPHPAGACLENEEVHLGRCFKKCSELTNGEYPTRIAAATCCKSAEAWKCLDFRNVKTRDAFDAGGGRGDGDRRTPRRPHFPMTAVTESAELADTVH